MTAIRAVLIGILFVGFFIGFLIGVGLLFFFNRIYKWSVDTFSGWLDWLGKKAHEEHLEPPAEPNKWQTWYCRVIGAGLVVMSVFALYELVTIFLF
jgi:hypothetical protein